MRCFSLFLVGMLLGACARPVNPPAVAPSASHVEAAKDLADKTIALVGFDTDGDAHAYCSGVWVSPNVAMTAFHCVDDSQVGDALGYVVREDVYTAANARKLTVVSRRATILALDDAHDLALIRAELPPPHRMAVPALGAVQQGEFAQSMGHSQGLWWTYSTGDVAAVRQIEINGMDLLWLQANAPISPGNSGGGLFDEEGRLIGIAHATFSSPRAQLLNVFVHRDYIQDFIKRARV
jgi:S1-C subfamily serine protease